MRAKRSQQLVRQLEGIIGRVQWQLHCGGSGGGIVVHHRSDGLWRALEGAVAHHTCALGSALAHGPSWSDGTWQPPPRVRHAAKEPARAGARRVLHGRGRPRRLHAWPPRGAREQR